MFLGLAFVLTCIAGGLIQGSAPFASTKLTATLTASANAIYVQSTNGFPDTGILVIESEHIAYSQKNATSFYGIPVIHPVIRGTEGTTAAAHTVNKVVRMPESSMFNNTIDYNVALLSDNAGLMSFITMPTAVFSLLAAFFSSPFAFLGTNLQMLTILWAVLAAGTLVSFFIFMAGGRKAS